MNINGMLLAVKEFNNRRVVTFKDIDRVHQRDEGIAKRNFTNNKKHFIENDDFYRVCRKDVGVKFTSTYGFKEKAPSGILITESGYLMLVKSFTDDLAWTVQRELVNNYFRVKETTPTPVDSPIVMNYRNIPVITCRELGKFSYVEPTKIGNTLRLSTDIIPNKDYFLLKDQSLEWFKENNDYPYDKIRSLYVITQSGAFKVMIALGISQCHINTMHTLLCEVKDAFGRETNQAAMNRRRALMWYLFDKLDTADQDKMLIEANDIVMVRSKNSRIIQNMIENF